jgi:hypothetical protein
MEFFQVRPLLLSLLLSPQVTPLQQYHLPQAALADTGLGLGLGFFFLNQGLGKVKQVSATKAEPEILKCSWNLRLVRFFLDP